MERIRAKVEAGEPLSREDGMALYEHTDILELGALANVVREQKNGNRTWFVVNRHINYTNVCVNRCRFCAFSRSPGEDGAYTMTVDEIVEKATSGPGVIIPEMIKPSRGSGG